MVTNVFQCPICSAPVEKIILQPAYMVNRETIIFDHGTSKSHEVTYPLGTLAINYDRDGTD